MTVTAERVALTDAQLDAYLARIGVDGGVSHDFAGLARLHRAHLTGITWEAIDAFMGWPNSVAPTAAYDKIVEGGRGGWCYEMNGLFGAALSALGFKVTRLCGCVDRPNLGDMAIGNHLTLRVDLDRPYLAEVGVADALIDPVPMTVGPIRQRGFEFAIEDAGDGWLRLRNHEFGTAPTVDFKPDHGDESALEAVQRFLMTDPGSPFTNALAVYRHVEDGYLSLQNDRLRHVTTAGVEARTIRGARELAIVLRETFELDVPHVDDIWAKVAARCSAEPVCREGGASAKSAAQPSDEDRVVPRQAMR